MTVLMESPWYQQILKEGEIRGLQKGEVSLIMRQITRRFGSVDDIIQAQIRQLSVEKLESLGESLFDFSNVNDLVNWLEQNADLTV